MAIRPSRLLSGNRELQTDGNYGEKLLYVIAITGDGLTVTPGASDIKHQGEAICW